MIRKGITEREAAEMWVERFNAVPTDMIGRLMSLDNHDNWTEVTKPSLCAGGDFYEDLWIPLYRARGMQWHDPATKAKEVA